MELIASFLTDRKFKVLVEGEFSTPRKIAAGVLHSSLLASLLYSLYINDAPTLPRTHLALFADGTCIYAAEKHEHRVLCKVQRGLTAVNSWCERWIVKINDRKNQAIFFSRRTNSLFRIWRLNINNKLALHKALIMSVMTYSCPTW
jgi:hypothetical protein